MVTAYLALGSNLGDRRAFLHAAAAALGQVAGTRLVGKSSIYETVPEGNAPEPLYLNAVVRVETSLTARQLLDAVLLVSGNDAANTLADMLGGYDVAVDKMNAKAAAIGATNTHATSPSGLDGPGGPGCC